MQVGSYRLSEVVGRGGMAQVWRATPLDAADPVALKIITATGSSNPRYRRYFDNEIGAVARLAHHGIVQVLDVGVLSDEEGHKLGLRPGSPYFAMDFVDGTTLAAPPVAITWPVLRDLVIELLDALAHAHAREVIHLDIKPANVLVRLAEDGRLQPVLTDFGIARIQDTLDSTDSERVLGTPGYMAPEQILGQWRDYGPWTDLYAVASVVWQLVTGAAPFGSETTYEVLKAKTEGAPPVLRPRTEVPEGLEAWLRRMMALNFRDRFHSAADAAWALRRLAHGTAVGSPPVPMDWRIGLHTPEPPRGGPLVGLRIPPFVGRESERDALWGALRETSRIGVRTMILEGAVGFGKTRLADWLRRRAAELGVADSFIVTHGAVRTPLDGLSGLLARHFRTTSLGRAGTVARIRDALADGGETDEGILIDAVSLGDIALPPGPTEAGRVMTGAETSRVVGRYLARVARTRPVVVVLDDIQWGADSIALIDALTDVHPGSPILVIATHRPTPGEAPPPAITSLIARGARTLKVGPLDRNALAELVRRLLPASNQLTRRLSIDARGNPAFVVETLADLMERGDLIRTSEGWRMRDDTQPSQRTLGGLWNRRVAFVVGTDAQQGWVTIEAAATLGIKFDGPQWRAVCQHLGVRISPDLVERLLRYRIVRLDVPEDREVDAYAFVHESLRQAILDHAAAGGRSARIEIACGTVLAEKFGQSADPAMLRRIATHFEYGERFADALPHVAAAALRHTHRAEFDAARALLDRHHALSEKLLTQDPEQTLRRELYRLWIDERCAVPIAHADVTDLLERARALGVIDLVCDAARLKSKLMRARNIEEANDELLAVIPALSEQDTPLALGRVYATIGWNCGLQGRWDEAFTSLDRATALFEEHADAHWASSCYRSKAYLLAQRGRYEEASATLSEAMDWARAGGDRNGLAGAYQHLGEVHRYQDEFAEAIELYVRAEDLFEGMNEVNFVAARINRALAEMGRSNDAEAVEILDTVSASIDRLASTSTVGPFGRLARCVARARGGDWSYWIEARDVAYDARQNQWRERDLAWLFELLGDAAAEQDLRDRAKICYDVATAVWGEVGHPTEADRAADKLNAASAS